MHDKNYTPPAAILSAMLDKDHFTRWMGIVVDEYREGYCRLHYTVKEEMLNGFGIVHGGILFSAADSAFAFACNSHGRISVALDAHISFIRSVKTGELLTVEATEVHTGNKTSFYNITTMDEHGHIVAMFKGTAYRTSRNVVEG
jgi:acyl-CoA thioesterase